jgi:hypothetical protein
MLEALLEILVELVLELVFQVVAQIGLALGLEALRHAVSRRRSANPVLAGLGLVILGVGLGLAGSLLLPRAVFRPSPHLSGVSLVLAPLGSGAMMHLFGRWRRHRGGDPGHLATFWGGALFAFVVAATRWWCVGRVASTETW